MSANNGKIVGIIAAGSVVQCTYLAWAVSGAEGGGALVGFGVLLAVLSAGAMSVFLQQVLGGSIDEVVKFIGQIVSGGAGLGDRVQVVGEDKLADALNGLLSSFQDGLGKAAGDLDRVKVMVKEMSNLARENQGSGNLEQDSNDVVQTISQMTAAVHEASQNAGTAAQAARDANQEADSGQLVVNNVTSSIHSLADEVERAATAIQKLEEDSESIGAILEVIRGIADQTNLLALNAAIEAARAGEQGRGFAVVADEVRTLAQRTQEATEEINDMIARLQEGSSNAVKVMAEGRRQAELSVEQASKAGESLTTITGAISSISSMNDQIAAAIEQQTRAADNITGSLGNMSEATSDSVRFGENLMKLNSEIETAVDALDKDLEQYVG